MVKGPWATEEKATRPVWHTGLAVRATEEEAMGGQGGAILVKDLQVLVVMAKELQLSMLKEPSKAWELDMEEEAKEAMAATIALHMVALTVAPTGAMEHTGQGL